MNQATHQFVRLDSIVESKTNPRKHFDPAALKDLADSIERHGVLQPILVRPIRTGSYELVAGARRYRSSKLAKLKEIPAIIREMTDTQALEVQVIENLQREDLHPLEEAEGYDQLIKADKAYDVKSIAAKVGKSESYVTKRLKLLALGAKGRKAFYEGKLNLQTAMLIARIPVESVQDEALKSITQYDMTLRSAMELVHRDYMLDLADAPFDTKIDIVDKAPKGSSLNDVTVAGPCTTCTKRTGNQPELFPDVKKKDVCTDPVCFGRKRLAWRNNLIQIAKEDGATILQGKQAETVWPYRHSFNMLRGYVRLDMHCHDDAKNRTFGQLLGKDHGLKPTYLDIYDQFVEVYPESAVKAAVRETHPTIKSQATRSSGKSDSQRAAEKKAKLEREVRTAILKAIHDKTGAEFSAADWQQVALVAFNAVYHETQKRVVELWGWTEEWKKQVSAFDSRCDKLILALKPADCRRLILDCAVVSEVAAVHNYGGADEKPAKLLALAQRYKVDASKIRRDATAQAKASEKPAAKKKAGKK